MRSFVDITAGQCKMASIVRFSAPALKIFSCVKPTGTLYFCLIALCFSSTLKAQSDSAATDPQVQNLYSDAKAAEARGDLAAAAATSKSLLQTAPRLGPAYQNPNAPYLKPHDDPSPPSI